MVVREKTMRTATTPTTRDLITALKERVSSLEHDLDVRKTTFEVREANSKSKISTLESKLESSEEKRAVIEAELAASEEAKAELAEELKVSKLARTRLQKRHDAILRKLDRTLDENTKLNSTLAENAPRIALADVNA